MMQTEESIILARYGACCVIGLSGVETTSVVSTPHGDRLEVLYHQQAERIRLNGIDCPEKGQAYGNNARYAASALTFGKEVTV
jgi:endonuclease YncB( thermonuclease family)